MLSIRKIAVTSLCTVFSFCLFAGESPTRDSITRKGYTLIVISKDPQFDPAVKSKLEETFFTVYPRLAKRFNKKTAPKVTFIIDPEYGGVAATSGGKVVYSTKWYQQHPDDIDVVTHEVMHIVQNYGNTSGPGWITEGIADYVRYKYGVANEASNWSLPEVSARHNYTDAYRVTARFFVWLENHKNKKIVDKLDKVMRNNTYRDSFWKESTGKTIDELWAEYAANPKL